jgi:hypothetical protein
MRNRFDVHSWLVAAAVLLSSLSATAHASFKVASASALPATVAPGQNVAIVTSVQSSAAAGNMLVDLEIYNSSGVKIGQTYYSGQSFTASQTRSYSWSFKVPASAAAGKYTLMVGVFTAGWTSDAYWNSAAASFTVATTPPSSGGGSGQTPSGLPSTFFIGLAANPNQLPAWVATSGVPWAMCYQYLSSGVTPGKSWVTTWGTNFAYNYATAAHSAGCIPELTYYQLVPTIGAEGAAAESAALKNTTTMTNYYKDFTALMKQLRQYGGTAVVHVEPDLFGYLQTINNNPAAIAASVASSGVADVASYPNTVAGFGRALVHLRDLYAPNVVLAAHVSTWMWGLSTSASLDVVSIAKNDAAFMTGLGNWDLFFTDISDRDAAYYQYVIGDHGAHWWDATNQKYPNFNRLNTWAAAFTSAAQKRLVIWQVPIGNTLMAAMNNTNYHYQDNREQYWLQNYPNNPAIGELVQAGVIGILFGAGNGGTTQNYDAAGDGVTNPKPINGNTRTSNYADDDGGLLRMNVGNYYKSGAAPLK